MDKEMVEDKIKEIMRFKKKNISVLREWENLINEAKDSIFKVYCIKKYQNECDPWHCGFRITDSCKYPQELSKLDELTRIS